MEAPSIDARRVGGWKGWEGEMGECLARGARAAGASPHAYMHAEMQTGRHGARAHGARVGVGVGARGLAVAIDVVPPLPNTRRQTGNQSGLGLVRPVEVCISAARGHLRTYKHTHARTHVHECTRVWARSVGPRGGGGGGPREGVVDRRMQRHPRVGEELRCGSAARARGICRHGRASDTGHATRCGAVRGAGQHEGRAVWRGPCPLSLPAVCTADTVAGTAQHRALLGAGAGADASRRWQLEAMPGRWLGGGSGARRRRT